MKTLLNIVLALLLVVVTCLPVRIHAVAAPNYHPGVRPGQWAEYRPLYNYCNGDATICSSTGNSIGNVRFAALQVLNMCGTSILLRLTTVTMTGTVSDQGVSVDVSTGVSNVTSFAGPTPTPINYFVLAGGLMAPDSIWNTQTAPTLNETRSENVLGYTRTVNFLNHTSSFTQGGVGVFISNGFAFDQETGLFLELSFSAASNSPYASYQAGFAMGMIDNNVWLSSSLPDFLNTGPDFSISSCGTISFQTGSSGSTSITLMGLNGFGGTFTLQASAPAGLSCSLDKTSIEGQGSTTLTCTGQPGSYTVTVTAASGQTSHSTEVGVQVSSLSTSTQTSKTTDTSVPSILMIAIVLAGLAVVAAVAVVLAFLSLRRRSNAPTVVPPGTPPAPTP